MTIHLVWLKLTFFYYKIYSMHATLRQKAWKYVRVRISIYWILSLRDWCFAIKIFLVLKTLCIETFLKFRVGLVSRQRWLMKGISWRCKIKNFKLQVLNAVCYLEIDRDKSQRNPWLITNKLAKTFFLFLFFFYSHGKQSSVHVNYTSKYASTMLMLAAFKRNSITFHLLLYPCRLCHYQSCQWNSDRRSVPNENQNGGLT